MDITEKNEQLKATKSWGGGTYTLKPHLNTQNVTMVIDALFTNLEYIPMTELEELIDKYRKI